jgi:hypothetical protein
MANEQEFMASSLRYDCVPRDVEEARIAPAFVICVVDPTTRP